MSSDHLPHMRYSKHQDLSRQNEAAAHVNYLRLVIIRTRKYASIVSKTTRFEPQKEINENIF